MERIGLVEQLANRTGYSPQDLCRALRGIPTEEVAGLLQTSGQRFTRYVLDQLVQETRAS
jgi:hypothetical protein